MRCPHMHKDFPENAICEDCGSGLDKHEYSTSPRNVIKLNCPKTLSSKIDLASAFHTGWTDTDVIPTHHVKEFIQKLKDFFDRKTIQKSKGDPYFEGKFGIRYFPTREIDKLAGDALIHTRVTSHDKLGDGNREAAPPRDGSDKTGCTHQWFKTSPNYLECSKCGKYATKKTSDNPDSCAKCGHDKLSHKRKGGNYSRCRIAVSGSGRRCPCKKFMSSANPDCTKCGFKEFNHPVENVFVGDDIPRIACKKFVGCDNQNRTNSK